MERHLITHWCHIRTNYAEEMFSLYTLYRVSYCPNLGVSLHSATILPTTSISRCWLSIFRQLIPYSGHLNSWKSPKHDIRTSKCVWLLSLTEQTDLHLIPLSRLCVKSKPIIRPKGRIRERNIVPSHLSILHFCAAHSIHICIPSLPCQDGNISPTQLHTERNFSQFQNAKKDPFHTSVFRTEIYIC